MEMSLDYSVYEKGKKVPSFKIDTDLSGEVTLEEFLSFTKRSLIIIADQVLREEQSQGFPKDPVVVVDGRLNKQVIDVNPLGKIQFIAKKDAVNEIILKIYESIVKRSPVDTGTYFDGNVVAYNGKVIATNKLELDQWAETDEANNIKPGEIVRFFNVYPYSGRLERHGVTAQRQTVREVKSTDKKKRSGETIQAPNGAYYLTSRSIRRTAKYNAKIYFEFIPGTEIGLDKLPVKTKAGQSLRKSFKPGPGQRFFGSYVYPSIRVIFTEGGIE